MKNEAAAKQILDRVENYLSTDLKTRDAIMNSINKAWNITDDSLALRYKNYRNALDNSKFGSGVVGFITAGGNVLISNVSGEDTVETVIGLGVDVALTLMELTPAGRVINIALTLTGFDPATKLKDIYRSLAYESEADYNNNKIAKLVGAKSVTIEKNILKVTMPDGTVYARPLSASFFPYGVTPSGLLTGGNGYTNDVLFGGNKNDTLQGGNGSDLLIGGDGYDIYNAGTLDIIRDSDGKGRVFLSSTNIQLTGGTQTKKGSKIYKGKDGVKYEISGYNLIINDNITIENFSNDNLEIHLSEFDEINVSISGATVVEKDQSMKFIVSLNKEPEVGKFVKVSVGKKTYKFMNFSETNYTIDEGVENVFGAQAEYEHVWNDDTVKEEDEKFKVTANIVDKSDGLKASVIKNGNGTIIDDDPEDVDPIIIDLNKNGITSTKLNNTIYFDHDNNNFKEASSWIDKGDAFLALDKNNNGLIDNGNELFGNHTISNTRFKYTNNKATNGYEALKTYDLNGDNVIDSKDEIYDKLVLWKDSNQNAITDKGELIKLKDSGIVSIDLNYKNINTDEKGNTIKQSSTITFEDGTTTIANDVWFKVNLDKTKHISIDEMIKDTLINLNKRQDELIKEYKENNNLNTNDLNNDESLQNILNSDEILKTYNDKLNTLFSIKSLPQVKAFGNLSSLREAMVNNPKLATMVNLY